MVHALKWKWLSLVECISNCKVGPCEGIEMGDDLWMARSVPKFSLWLTSCNHKDIIIARILFLQSAILVLCTCKDCQYNFVARYLDSTTCKDCHNNFVVRYLLHRVSEDFGLLVTMDPKPMQVGLNWKEQPSLKASEKVAKWNFFEKVSKRFWPKPLQGEWKGAGAHTNFSTGRILIDYELEAGL